MAPRRVSWTLRSFVIAVVIFSTDFLLFGRPPLRYFPHEDRPGDWTGLLGADKRIFLYLPLLVFAIVWALRSQRAGRGATLVADAGAERGGVDRLDDREAEERRRANAERRRAISASARQAARAEVARFPLAGLSVSEKLERDKTNGQIYLLIGALAFIGYLLGVALFDLKGAATLAPTLPALALLVRQVRQRLEPIEVAVGAEGLTLRAPGTESVVPMARIESAESTKNARGDAVLVVVRQRGGHTDDLLVGLLDGRREVEAALVERADAIAARIEAVLATNDPETGSGTITGKVDGSGPT